VEQRTRGGGGRRGLGWDAPSALSACDVMTAAAASTASTCPSLAAVERRGKSASTASACARARRSSSLRERKAVAQRSFWVRRPVQPARVGCRRCGCSDAGSVQRQRRLRMPKQQQAQPPAAVVTTTTPPPLQQGVALSTAHRLWRILAPRSATAADGAAGRPSPSASCARSLAPRVGVASRHPRSPRPPRVLPGSMFLPR
jgi:hypothetical protein